MILAAAAWGLPCQAQQGSEPARNWYGWQLLIVDLASLGAVSISSTMAQGNPGDSVAHTVRNLGYVGLLAAGPAIHLGHGAWDHALVSSVIRTLPIAGGLLLARRVDSCGFDPCVNEAVAALLLFGVGGVGTIVDWLFVSWEPQDRPRDERSALLLSPGRGGLRADFALRF
jgi:hypothetical protein